MKKVFLSLLLVVSLVSSVYGADAKLSAECSNGNFIGVENDGIISWKGVPYAQPPVGELRWKAPQAPQASSEIISADKFGKMPLQYTAEGSHMYGLPQGEDCLYLNVWKADTESTEKRPVMVWIHGGAFRDGGTASKYYDGASFAKAHDDVIFVSVGYRLGLMGFIDFVNSGIEGGENYPDSGNLGILDLLQSLKWLHENISAFGGDPDNITVFGQSSGAACVSLLMTLDESAGLFKRAITESGAVSMTTSIDDSKALTQNLIELIKQLTGAQNINNMTQLLALDEGTLQGLTALSLPVLIFPERDGKILSADISDIYSTFSAKSLNFDLLTGSNANELNYWKLYAGEKFSDFIMGAYEQIVGGIASISQDHAALAEQFVALRESNGDSELDAKVEFFNDLLFRVPSFVEVLTRLVVDVLAGINPKTYMYYWEYPSDWEGLGACHGIDFPYVLNIKDDTVMTAYNQDFANKVQSLWVNFAKTGNPSTENIPWPEYSGENNNVMHINENFEVRDTKNDAVVSEQNDLISLLAMYYGISGRELINGVASMLMPNNDTPGNDTPGNDTPGTDTPGTDTPSNETPGTDTPGTDTPSNETPGTDTPSNETPTQTTSTVASNGGGCNMGFMMPFALLAAGFAFKKVRA